MWNLRQFGEVTIFDRKMPTAPDLRKRRKFWHFLKNLQNSWNLHRIYWNQYQKHACEIWGSLEKLQFLTEKCRPLEIGWNFVIFSKFSKILGTYRIYWNHLQEHACEAWSSLEKFQFSEEKCRHRWISEKGWNFDIFSKLQNSWNLQNLLESVPETCMWKWREFGEVTNFDRKIPSAQGP